MCLSLSSGEFPRSVSVLCTRYSNNVATLVLFLFRESPAKQIKYYFLKLYIIRVREPARVELN